MIDRDRERIEARLKERSDDLRKTRRAARMEGEGMLSGELSRVDNHPAEQGTETHDLELDVTTGILLDEEERRIAEARHALEADTYGSCIDCGEPVGSRRLDAVPEAVRCIDCQRHFEGGHRQHHDGLS